MKSSLLILYLNQAVKSSTSPWLCSHIFAACGCSFLQQFIECPSDASSLARCWDMKINTLWSPPGGRIQLSKETISSLLQPRGVGTGWTVGPGYGEPGQRGVNSAFWRHVRKRSNSKLLLMNQSDDIPLSDSCQALPSLPCAFIVKAQFYE